MQSGAWSGPGFKSRRAFALTCLLAAASAASCASTRLDQFHDLARAGQAYTDAVGKVLDEAGEASIDLRSALLAGARGPDGADAAAQELLRAQRAQQLAEANQDNAQRLELLGDLRAHSLLLRGYFAALANLAEAGADDGIGDAAAGVATRLSALGVKIAGLELSGQKVQARIRLTSAIAVGIIRKQALERELRARSGAIAAEIEVERAALDLLGEVLDADLATMTNLEDTRLVWDPYTQPGPLPDDWALLRKRMLTRRALPSAARAAVSAVAALDSSFVALCETRSSRVRLDSLLDAVDEVTRLVEKYEKGGA